MLHTDRERAQSFGADADRYDRARPSYPTALLDDLLEGAQPSVLDVGTGTGKAAELFAARGCRVLGVEADDRMADRARQKGIDVEVATFEAWEPAGRRFDLVVAAQAWHWVDPRRAPAKAADVLSPGGRLAPFWNTLCAPDDAITGRFATAYRRVAPEVGDDARSLGLVHRLAVDTPAHAEAIERCGRFGPCEVRTHRWTRAYTTAEWLDLLPTISTHRLLGPERLARLTEEIGDALEDLGGRLELTYETVVLVAPLAP